MGSYSPRKAQETGLAILVHDPRAGGAGGPGGWFVNSLISDRVALLDGDCVGGALSFSHLICTLTLLGQRAAPHFTGEGYEAELREVK